MLNRICVIIPIYKGHQYIEKLINMFDECAANVNGSVELVFVNDYPQEKLITEGYSYSNITVCFYENDCNCGIHQSRINGLNLGNSEYVLFFDQDDIVSPKFLCSQLESIKDASMVVANGLDRGKKIFYNHLDQVERLQYENFFSGSNTIVSPGQVLIKRNDIPEKWKTNIMHTNCADDYYLWILMALEEKKFAVNDEVVFLHTYSGHNTSNDEELMMLSEIEMIDILTAEGLLSPNNHLHKHRQNLINYREKLCTDPITRLNKRNAVKIEMLNAMIIALSEGKSMLKIFKKEHIEKIVIYGFDVLGQRLNGEAERIGITVEGYMDKSDKVRSMGVPRIIMGEKISEDTVIVVTSATQFNIICKAIREKYNNRIVSLDYLIFNMNASL